MPVGPAHAGSTGSLSDTSTSRKLKRCHTDEGDGVHSHSGHPESSGLVGTSEECLPELGTPSQLASSADADGGGSELGTSASSQTTVLSGNVHPDGDPDIPFQCHVSPKKGNEGGDL